MSTNANAEPFIVKDCALLNIATGKKAQKPKRNERSFTGHPSREHIPPFLGRAFEAQVR